MADVGSLAAQAVAQHLGIPVVFTLAPDPHAVLHALDMTGALDRSNFGAADEQEHYWFRARLVHRLAADAEHVVLFPRQELRHELRELLGIDVTSEPQRYTVVPEGIDLAVSEAASEDVAQRAAVAAVHHLEELVEGLSPERHGLPLVISVGRLHRVKGMATVVEAWATDPGLRDRCNLVIVGGDLDRPSPDEHGQLQRIAAVLASTPGAASGLVLAGHRPNDVVARWLAAAHAGLGSLIAPGGVYVCGSLKEEFGLAILEAMAAGLPVVAPAGGGPATYVEDGVTGVLVDTRSAKAVERRHGRCSRPRPRSRTSPAGRAARAGPVHRAGNGTGAHPGVRHGRHWRPAATLMTLLVISPDYASHVLPLATLATAWRDAGSGVVVATGPATAGVVASFGFERADLRLGRGSNPGVIRAEQQPVGEDSNLRAFFAATRRGMVDTLRYQADARRDDLLWEPAATARAVLRVVDRVRPDHVLVDHLAFSATLAMRAGGVPYGDVVLGHPSALPVGDEVYGYPTTWPRAFHPDQQALADLHRRCVEVREAFTATWNEALAVLNPASSPVPDAFAAHGDVLLFNYPAELHPADRTTLLPPHVFLGSAVRGRARGTTMWPSGSTPTIPDLWCT